MAQHRIGKDLLVRWRMVDKQGVPYDISRMDLKIELVDFFGRRKDIVDYAVENTSKIVFTFAAADQKLPGAYTLIAYFNKGKEGQSVIDACNCFELVDCIHQESDQGLGGTAVEYEDLVSTIEIGIEGKSAYASWLTVGNTGTEKDFVDSLSEPARQAQRELQNLGEELNRSEASRASAEAIRVKSESERASAESSRASEEVLRQSSENTRNSNEALRVQAENSRVSEFTRLKAESENATAKAVAAERDANIASGNAVLAASDARNAADDAKELNDHPLMVGSNGNWWAWSLQGKCYIDTGNPSRGDVCYPVFEVDPYTMQLHVRRPQSMPDGMFRLENGKLILKV